MSIRITSIIAGGLILLSGLNNEVIARHPDKPAKKHRPTSMYFSWGYNTEWYTPSTVRVKQESLGNDFVMHSVKAHDNRGWDKNLLKQQFTIPQYNYRLGIWLNKKQDLGFEINFDHTKYIITDEQYIHVTGKINNNEVNQDLHFTRKDGFYYFLNNGANFLLFNVVKRMQMYQSKDRNVRLDFLGRAGIGPVIPHVENSFFGKANDKGFQIGGWNTGLESAVRATFFKYAYLEFAQKVDYARYSNLKVYEGRARQAFGTFELILSLGVSIPTSRNSVLFERVELPEKNLEKAN